jgi:endonuclease/exonuclease/phosphatase family metal-dependent hydrolase
MTLACAGCAAQRSSRAPLTAPSQRTIGTHSSASAPTSLTVATYNLHGLRDRSAVRRDLAALEGVTVWCFQEVPYVDACDVERILLPGRWHVATIPANRVHPAGREWEAQVIASRFPIQGVEVWPLDEGGAKRRVALAARLNVGGRRVLVVNADHEPSILAWRDGNSVQTRRLTEHLQAYDDDLPVIVVGDFNCSGNLYRLIGNMPHVRRLDAALARVGFTPVGAGGSTFRSGIFRAHLDRIYARNLYHAEGAIATKSTGSDHLPVWSRFEVTPTLADAPLSDAAAP